MALRLGTGGLKYPIPVAPDAQQSIAAASAGGSAAASAYGANRSFAANKMRVQADLANSAAERDFRARSQMEEQGFRARENFYDREHQAGAQLQGQEFRANQEELDRNFRAFQQQSGQNFQLNRDKAEMEFTRERDQAQFDRSQADERVQDESIKTGISSGDLVLSKGGQAAWDKLQSDRAAAALQKDLSPEGRAEAERKFDERERGILRTARPPLVSATDRANNNQTFYDPQTGRYEKEMAPGRVPGTLGKDGQFQQTMEKPDTSKEDQRRQSWIDKRADELMKQENDDGEPLYSPEDAARMAMQDWDKRQKGFQPGQTAPPPAPAPGQQPNAPAPGQPATVPPPAPQPPPETAPPAPITVINGGYPTPIPGKPFVPSPNQPVQSPSPGQQAPSVPLPGKAVGPTPTPQTLPLNPATASSAGPVPLDQPGAQAASTDAFTKQWSALPPGGTMIGPDGKFYTKKK